MEKTKKKYFIIEVKPEDHALVKVLSARRGISLKVWIMRAIAEKIKQENKNNDVSE